MRANRFGQFRVPPPLHRSYRSSSSRTAPFEHLFFFTFQTVRRSYKRRVRDNNITLLQILTCTNLSDRASSNECLSNIRADNNMRNKGLDGCAAGTGPGRAAFEIAQSSDTR